MNLPIDARRLALAIALTAALAVIAGSSRQLFQSGPPMLDRWGRAVAILLVPGAHIVAALAVASAAWRAASSRCSVARWSIALAILFTMTSWSFHASWLAFVGLHAVCYQLAACGWTSIPESAQRAVALATTEPAWEALLALPVTATAASWLRGRASRR